MAFSTLNLCFSAYMLLLIVCNASASEGGSGYGSPSNPESGGSERMLSTMIGVQGLIYCKRGSKLIPIEGAVARITCETRDEYGYEAKAVTVLSQATGAKGYFLATLSPSEVKEETLKMKECRAYLELSPLESCNFPTDINGGIKGSILSSYRLLRHSKMKLFTVGPFVFAPEEPLDKSTPNGY